MGIGGHEEFTGTERFEIAGKLGEGGMGVVYEAFDRERGERVAIKLLPETSAANLYRFKREFRTLADIEHPNLVALGELFESTGHWFFTMELIDGVDFLQYVRPSPGSPDRVPFQEDRLRSATRQLGVAIAALHEAGKVHRDIKPSNCLIDSTDRLVLLDFGLVADLADDIHRSTQSHVVGTAAYMAPEQALSGDVGPAADWYSLGTILYHALTDQLPFDASSTLELLMQKQQYAPPPPRARVANVPADLDDLCVDLLSRNPADRPTARAILSRLGVSGEQKTLAVGTTTSRFTQSMPFVGRTAELERLRAAFDESRTHPVVAIIEGESGLGKSELASRFTQRICDDLPETVVLTGRCYERESVAYKAVDGVVDVLAQHLRRMPKDQAAQLLPQRASLLPRLFPVLQRVEVIARAPAVAPIVDPQEMRRQMFDALRELLAAMAEQHPLILVIDDLQWTDDDSLTLLQELLSHAQAPRLLLVATMRPIVAGEREDLVAAIDDLAYSHVIRLAALTRPASQELATLLLPGKEPDELAALIDEADGHPLFLQELVRFSEDNPNSASASLDEMLWSRISRLRQEHRTVLQLVSLAGTPVPQEVVATAAETDFATFLKAASTLRVGYLLRTSGARATDTVATYHDRVREVMLAHLDPSTARSLHERLAVALESAGAAASNPHALVRHAEASGDAARAAAYAESAATHAVNAMAFHRAAQFFETALRLGDHDADRKRELQLALARVFVNAGRGPRAAEMFSEAASGAEPATRLECQRGAAEQWLISGHIERGLGAMTELLAEIGERIPSTPRRALWSLIKGRALLALRGKRVKLRPASTIPRDVLTRIDVHRAASHGLVMVDSIRGFDFQSRRLRLALRTGEPSRIAAAMFEDASVLASPGGKKHIARARQAAARAAALAPAEPYLAAWELAVSGSVSYFASEFRDAADTCADAERRLRQQAGVAWELGTVRLFQLWSLLRMGAFREMGPLLDDYLRDALRRGDIYARTSMIRSCHALWLANDRLDNAVRELDRATWTPSDDRYHVQHWHAFRARCEIRLYRGTGAELYHDTADDFAALGRSLLTRVVSIRNESLSLLGRLALVAAAGADDPAPLLRAAVRTARRLEREGDAYSVSCGLLLRAAQTVQEGNLDLAVELLKRARRLSTQNHMLLHAAVVQRRLGELLGGDEGAALITRASDWMRSETIVSPERMTDVVAPGFARH